MIASFHRALTGAAVMAVLALESALGLACRPSAPRENGMDKTGEQSSHAGPDFVSGSKSKLDAIAEEVKASAPFDISPRGIAFRPSQTLAAKVDELIAQGDAAVPALAARLETEADALLSMVWLSALVRIQTPKARAAIDAFVDSMIREKRWEGQFPGRREILLFLGRSDEGRGTPTP